MEYFAARMSQLQPEGAFAVLTKAKAMERAGRRILHFEIGQPDFPTPEYIVDAAICALKDGKTKYTSPLGIPELRRAIAEEITKTRKTKTFIEQVAVTPSPKTALFLSFAALIEPGDEVIYPDPGFPTYEILTDFFGGTKKPVPVLEKFGFAFDIAALKKHFSSKTRLVVLNSPANPTGGVISKKDFAKIAELVAGNPRCFVLSDEVYSRILYDGMMHESIYSFSGMRDKTFLVDGFSKTYAMTGWRLGYLVFPHISGYEKKIDYLATNSYSCAAAFTQYAGLAALTGPQNDAEHYRKEFEKRRNVIVRGLCGIPRITCRIPQGAFYAFPNVRVFKKTSQELADILLEDAGVALLDGAAFGPHGAGYLRLSYANSLEHIEEALEKMKTTLQNIL
jgi:aspartate aminotransferase